jgi:hypothetical protein
VRAVNPCLEGADAGANHYHGYLEVAGAIGCFVRIALLVEAQNSCCSHTMAVAGPVQCVLGPRCAGGQLRPGSIRHSLMLVPKRGLSRRAPQPPQAGSQNGVLAAPTERRLSKDTIEVAYLSKRSRDVTKHFESALGEPFG